MKLRHSTYNHIPGKLQLMRLAASAILLTLLSTFSVNAETVSLKEAKEKAQLFFNQAYKEVVAPVDYVYNGKKLTTDHLFTPFYVFNQKRGGFVIISAENKAFPILGYSLKENFNPDKLSSGEIGWLKNFAFDIEMIRYDSRQPEEAIEAWQNYPQYISAILNAPYEATDPKLELSEVENSIEAIITTDDESEDGKYSAFYTPEQWMDLINWELDKNENVAIGFVDISRNIYPGIVHGRKGDYYRIEFDQKNTWLLRLSPTEYLGERLVASLGNTTYTPEPDEEEEPFSFYAEIIGALNNDRTAAENALNAELDKPLVKSIGSGHFDVILPENITLTMLYNINGAHIGRATYQNTPMAHIDIEKEPHGFYFAMIVGESGKIYGIKLYR